MNPSALLSLALTACATAQGSTTDAKLGRVVTEIDPRIWCMDQDARGDHWFGSNGKGVYRYDGQRVIHYTEADGLAGHQVRDIEEDADGNVLIATNSGVSKFDGNTFTTLEVVEARTREEGWRLNPDDVWIVFKPGEYGPCRYDGDKLYHLQLSESPAEGAHRARYPDVRSPLSGIYSIFKDRRGHLWFGTAAAGLCRYDGQTLSWMYEERLTTTPNGGAFGIRSIYEDRAGDLWICNTRQRFKISPDVKTEDGYSLLQYEQIEGLPDAQSDTDDNFHYCPSMTEDKSGALWMACAKGGALKYDGEDVTRYRLDTTAYVVSVLCDREGKIWLGTVDAGIYRLEGERFARFEPPEPGK